VKTAAVGVSTLQTKGNKMPDDQSRWLDMDGGRVHYLVEGQEPGPTIVLLHGASFTAQSWKQIGTLNLLSGLGYRVFAIDLPGYGKSPASNVPPHKWLGKVLEQLHIESPVVVAPSMSGQFALPLVTGAPDQVAGFVAVAPVAIPHYAEQLGCITAPVLAIWGENDRTIPIEHADMLVQAVKKGRKEIIPEGSHAPYMSDPDKFHSELLKFLSELPSTK
jgi:pimeloyl-ACP methyl ester carboxylesterase